MMKIMAKLSKRKHIHVVVDKDVKYIPEVPNLEKIEEN